MLLKDFIAKLQEVYTRHVEDKDYYEHMGEPVVYTQHYAPLDKQVDNMPVRVNVGYGELDWYFEVDGTMIIVQKEE